MGRISTVELCQKLKSEAVARQDSSAINDLRIRILEYFLNKDIPEDIFEDVLEARLNNPDPAKEQSKVICAEILKAWQTRPIDRL